MTLTSDEIETLIFCRYNPFELDGALSVISVRYFEGTANNSLTIIINNDNENINLADSELDSFT